MYSYQELGLPVAAIYSDSYLNQITNFVALGGLIETVKDPERTRFLVSWYFNQQKKSATTASHK